jgi:hypothetical protein
MSENEQRPFVPPPEYVEKSAPVAHLVPATPAQPVTTPTEPIPQYSAPTQHLVPTPAPSPEKTK